MFLAGPSISDQTKLLIKTRWIFLRAGSL